MEGSRTSQIASNLEAAGRYVFRIDSAEIGSGGCNIEGDSLSLSEENCSFLFTIV